ncbi:30S ribosomal protein S3 [Candidatus Pacearchaeota archaeon]|nr:30S ribosomal protein S3 [Candidatus Pacearchaeota archaeon]|tara:strand:+ start:25006 stop:25725 length:720 start_codon:yes stop_codon:yes gene_type:complete
MEEKQFVGVRKDEYNIKQFVKRMFGKGIVSKVKIEYTPVGEKIIVSTHKPGFVIGKKGEKIASLTTFLKKKFKMENPHVDIEEITHPEFDAQIVADDLAVTLERFGSMKYKSASYRALSRIKQKGAQGAELRVTGKLPSDRARSWRFSFGYLKKTGDAAKAVDRAEAVAETKKGIVGIKVAILAPNVKMADQIEVNEELLEEIKKNASTVEDVEEIIKKKKVAKKTRKKTTKKVKKDKE